MRSGRTTFLNVAFAFSSAVAVFNLQAADPAPAAAPAGQPEKIEFSRSSSTAPKIPRPGFKNDDGLSRYGNVRESGAMPAPNVSIAPQPGIQTLPSKAAAEKLLKEWDRKKNWALPGADEVEKEDPFGNKLDLEKQLATGDKPEGLTERYLKGEESKKNKTDGPQRVRDLDRDRTNNRMEVGPHRDRADRTDDRDDKEDGDRSRRDPNDNSESNGLAEFDLKKFIRQQNQPNFLNNDLPKTGQLFRPGFGAPQNYQERGFDRTKAKERDAASSAEFMRILRSPSSTVAGVGANDPINGPDLSRREMNPVMPQSSESSRGPFTPPPPSPSSRIQDNSMFGVTGPAASSMAPTISAPVSRPEPVRARAVVIEPPRRIF